MKNNLAKKWKLPYAQMKTILRPNEDHPTPKWKLLYAKWKLSYAQMKSTLLQNENCSTSKN